MTNLKQAFKQYYITNKRMINFAACLVIIISNITFRLKNHELQQDLLDMAETYRYFKLDYDKTEQVNIRLKAMYDNLHYQYDELAAGSYCINSIEEGGE